MTTFVRRFNRPSFLEGATSKDIEEMADLALIYDPSTGKLKASLVDTSQIKAGALAATTSGRAIMADGFIISAKIGALAVGTGHIAWNAIVSGKVAAGAILSGNIVSGQVGVSHIASFDPLRAAMINYVIDGGGSEISSGEHGHLIVPFGCTIKEVSLLGDQSGAIQIDIWKDTHANFPPTSVDTIASGLKPLISGGFKYQDSNLSGWTTAITSGDILAYHADLISALTRVTVGLRVEKS